ncbi:MAG: CHC2 zinc finger domain-containing protein [Faecalibacterium prausnitzii]
MRKPVQGFPIRQGLLKIRRRSIFKNNNLFEIVKRNITTRQAAEAYGFRPNRSSMICCPFHTDRNPSMKVDSRFHCFGCGADGDVIDFTAKLFQLSLRRAAEKLVADFGLSRILFFHYSIRKLWNIKVKTQSKHCTSAARF